MNSITINNIKKKYLIKTSIFIGSNKKERNYYLKQILFTTKKNIDIIKIDNLIYSLKEIALLLTEIAIRKGEIWHINNQWKNGQLSNIKKNKTNINFPSILSINYTKDKKNYATQEAISYNIPIIQQINTNQEPRAILYPLYVNTKHKKTNILISKIMHSAIKTGYLKNILLFNKQNQEELPRLDSNQ